MKWTTFLVLMILGASSSAQVPSAHVKIKEKSGFLGMSGPRFVEIRLSNETQSLPLNDINVNGGQFYFFLCVPVGDWQFDSDFIEDEVPKLWLLQGEQKFPVEWNKDFTEGDSAIVLGFNKQLRLEQAMKVQFQEGEVVHEAEFGVPVELWPGFGGMQALETRGAAAMAAQDLKTAVGIFDQILARRSFSIFPSYSGYLQKRTNAFSTFFDNQWNAASGVVGHPQTELKTKIRVIDSLVPEFRWVADSLPSTTLGVTRETPGVGAILDKVQDALSWAAAKRDSLQQALDDQNVRWIYNGSVAGRTGFLYQTMLEALAYAFSSLDFTDTAATTLVCTLPEDQRANLVKNNLVDSYDTFLRLTNDRYRDGLSLFPADFLLNVRRDTGSFRLPFASMLRAVNEYYGRRYREALVEIFRIFRISYDAEISARFDQMRIMIQVREGEFRPEALRLLQEGAALESVNPEEAGEKYRQATIIAPDFAYASFSLGKFYSRMNDPIRAQTFFERAYQTDTLYLSAFREAFNLFRRVGNYKPMIQVLVTALDKGNDYWETHSNLGLAYMGDGDPARAIQQYERALSINPRSYTTNIQLGLAYQTVKNYQKAREYFNNAINIDPLRQEAVEYLSRLNELQRTGK